MAHEALAYKKPSIQWDKEEAGPLLGSEVTLPTTVAGSPPPPDQADIAVKSRQHRPLRTYKWRWVVLALFSLNNAVTNYIWIMSAIIANVMKCYYGISDTMVNLLTTSYMMMYVLLVWPVAWAMDKYGLRKLSIVASAAMTLGAALRIAGTGIVYFFSPSGQCY